MPGFFSLFSRSKIFRYFIHRSFAQNCCLVIFIFDSTQFGSDISEPVVGEKTMEITRSLGMQLVFTSAVLYIYIYVYNSVGLQERIIVTGSIRQSALAFQSPVSISKAMYTQTASSAMASPIQPELSMDLTKAFGSIKVADFE